MWHVRSSCEQDGGFVKSRVDRRGAARRQEEGKGSGGEEGGELTCPTQGATLQPSRAEDTVQARTLCNRVLQKVCKRVKFLCFGQRTKQWKRRIWEEGSGCKTAMVSFWRIRTQQTVQIAKVYGLVQNNEKNITKLFCARYAFVLPHNVTSEMSNLSFWPEQNRSPIR